MRSCTGGFQTRPYGRNARLNPAAYQARNRRLATRCPCASAQICVAVYVAATAGGRLPRLRTRKSAGLRPPLHNHLVPRGFLMPICIALVRSRATPSHWKRCTRRVLRGDKYCGLHRHALVGAVMGFLDTEELLPCPPLIHPALASRDTLRKRKKRPRN
jgi:hypothetical protein